MFFNDCFCTVIVELCSCDRLQSLKYLLFSLSQKMLANPCFWISSSVCLLVTDYLSFIIKNDFILPLFWKDIFAGYNFFFPFSTFKISFHFLLTFLLYFSLSFFNTLSQQNYLHNFWREVTFPLYFCSLYIMCYLFLVAMKILLYLVFWRLTVMCLDLVLLVSTFPSIYWTYRFVELYLLLKMENFGHYIFRYTFAPF